MTGLSKELYKEMNKLAELIEIVKVVNLKQE